MMAAQPEHDSMSRFLSDPSGGPTVLRIVLGTQLRRRREENRISREDAGKKIRASHAKISRLELGRVGFKQQDVTDLLNLYQVTDERKREEYLTLAREANNPGWWQKYGDVLPDWLRSLVGLEEAASVIRTFEVQFVPGLLQTKDYALAVTKLGHPRSSPQEVEQHVALRMERQEVLDREYAPKLWTVVDEAALRRPLGNRDVLRKQLTYLLERSEQRNITLQVAPFHIGGLAAAGGPVTILRFSEPDLPDIVYLEQLTSGLYLDKREEVENYRVVMDQLCAEAETNSQTRDFLHGLLKEI